MAIGFNNGQIQYYGTDRPRQPYQAPQRQPIVTQLGPNAQQLDYTPRRPTPGYAAPGAGGGAGGGVNYGRLLGGGAQPQDGRPPVIADPMSYWNQKAGGGAGGGGQGAYKGGLRVTTDNPLDVGFAQAINQKNGYGANNPWNGASDPWGGGGAGGAGFASPRAVNRLGVPAQAPAAGGGSASGASPTGGNAIGDALQKYTDQANQANESRYQKLLGMAGQLSDAGMQREQRREQAGMGRVAQQSISAGLGNTTILPTLQRGVQDDSALRQEQVADQGLKTQMGIVERRTDLPPDYALLASLAARPGAGFGPNPLMGMGAMGGFGGGGAIGGTPRYSNRGRDAMQAALEPSRGNGSSGGDQGPLPPGWQQTANDAANIANGDTDAAGQWAQAGGGNYADDTSPLTFGDSIESVPRDASALVRRVHTQGFDYGGQNYDDYARQQNPVDYLALLQKMFGGAGRAMGML